MHSHPLNFKLWMENDPLRAFGGMKWTDLLAIVLYGNWREDEIFVKFRHGFSLS